MAVFPVVIVVVIAAAVSAVVAVVVDIYHCCLERSSYRKITSTSTDRKTQFSRRFFRVSLTYET